MPASNQGSVPKPTLKLRKSSTVVFSSSGRFLAQITSKVIVWDLLARKVVTQVKLLRNESYVCFSPDERVLAAKNTNGEFVFYDLQANEVISATGRYPWAQEGGRPVFTPDGKHVIDGDWKGGLRRLEVASAKAVDEHHFGFGYMSGGCLADPITGKTFVIFNAKHDTRGGGKVLIYSHDQPLDAPTVFHPASRQLSEQGGWRHVSEAALHPSGKGLAFYFGGRSAKDNGSIELIDLSGEALVSIPMESPSHRVYGMAWSASGRLCASVHENSFRQGMGYTEWQVFKESRVFEHIRFFADSSGEDIGRWPWRGTWGLAFSPADDGLAIGGTKDPSVLYSPLPIAAPASRLF